MNDDQSDEALVRAAIAGCDDAYQLLIERYQNLVWQLLNRLIPQLEDREELAQDVFIKVYFKLAKFRFESQFSTWLYTVTYRTALSHLRKVKVQFEELDEELHEKPHEFSASSESAEEFDVALHRALDQAVANLGLEDRTVISLYHQQGCTIEEIATIVNKPIGTIKNQLFRARKRLKRTLESTLGEEARNA